MRIGLITIVFPTAEVLGYDPIFPEVEKVPLRPHIALCLHGPKHPAITRLKTVQLGQEEIPQEHEVVLSVVGNVAIVVPGKDITEKRTTIYLLSSKSSPTKRGLIFCENGH